MTGTVLTPPSRQLGQVDYRWRLWNFRGWFEVGNLPLRNVSYGWKLNDVGICQGSLGLQEGLPPLIPGEHILIVERNGEPVWAGPIWSAPFDTASAYVQFNASEWGSYLKRRRIRIDRSNQTEAGGSDNSFRQVDQFDIVRYLIFDSESQYWGQGDLNLRWLPTDAPDWGWSGRTLSGVLRDRQYKAIDRKELWEAIQQLSEVIDGFDFRFRVAYVREDLVPIIWLEMFYPRQGLSQDRHNLVFEYREGWPGSNVNAYRWNDKADEMANFVEAANEEAVEAAFDSSAWAFYPALDAMVQKGGEGGVTNTDTLKAHAEALLADVRRPRNEVALELVPGVDWVGPDLIGSEVRVRLTSWRHPPGPNGQPGFDGFMRVQEVNVTAPSDERPEGVTVNVAAFPGGRP